MIGLQRPSWGLTFATNSGKSSGYDALENRLATPDFVGLRGCCHAGNRRPAGTSTCSTPLFSEGRLRSQFTPRRRLLRLRCIFPLLCSFRTPRWKGSGSSACQTIWLFPPALISSLFFSALCAAKTSLGMLSSLLRMLKQEDGAVSTRLGDFRGDAFQRVYCPIP